MPYTIRRAVQEDAPGIADLARAIGWFHWMNEQPPDVVESRLSQHLALCLQGDSHSVYIAETDYGEIIGFTSVHWSAYLIHHGLEGYVSELFVRESERGQGLGCSLLESVTEEAKSRGCARLLLLNVRTRESYQREFYRKQGWLEWEDAAVFIYPLS
jgi:GNAT superfamily N-acetyltransferase